MKKQKLLFLIPEDESQFSRELKACIPNILFLNDNVWNNRPDCRGGIEQCDSGRAYLYGGDLSELPTIRRNVGDIQGPASGCVIQFIRSKVVDEELVSGEIGVGFNASDTHMKEFVSQVWKCLLRCTTTGVARADGTIDNHFCIGPAAKRQACADEIQLVDGGRIIRFFPKDCPPQ